MNNKKRLIAKIILFLSLIGCIVSIIIPNYTSSSNYYNIVKFNNIFMEKHNKIEQRFISDGNYSSFGFMISNKQFYPNSTKLDISIIGNNKIKNIRFKAKKIVDSNYYYNYYNFKYKLKKGKEYRVIIKTDKKIPIRFGTTAASIKNASLLVDDEVTNSNLTMIFTYMKPNYFAVWYFLLIISVDLCYLVFIRQNTNDKTERQKGRKNNE